MTTEQQKFEVALRAKAIEAETTGDRAYAALHAVTVHPNSIAYKTAERSALMASGVFVGLLTALDLLTGENALEERCTDALARWMPGAIPERGDLVGFPEYHVVTSAEIPKDRVFGYLTRRNEFELLVHRG